MEARMVQAKAYVFLFRGRFHASPSPLDDPYENDPWGSSAPNLCSAIFRSRRHNQPKRRTKETEEAEAEAEAEAETERRGLRFDHHYLGEVADIPRSYLRSRLGSDGRNGATTATKIAPISLERLETKWHVGGPIPAIPKPIEVESGRHRASTAHLSFTLRREKEK
ncbi:hypothetical protein CDL15_Pgr010489 [Punica granatum]|uniref:Uncharacterized protein n=1 Tax=Punica granatum TaxID=22663 RepID=A0A218XW50_PUNGR|nr:hypothetical protein CDL15_Pgr010489 [Punica granatum]